MFSFLNSGILLGIVAVSIPFIIHFLAKRKYKPVQFSSIFFLKQMQSNTMRRINIKQWILLILRALAILCLVLAFARPAVKGVFKSSHTQSASVILVDQSMSMMRREIASKLNSSLSALLDEFEPDDELLLFGTEMPMDAFEWTSKEIGKKKIKNLQPVLGMHSLSDNLNLAIQSLKKKKSINKEIFILSDFQTNAFAQSDTMQTIQDFDGHVYLLEQTGKKENLSAYDLTLSNQIVELNHKLILHCMASNWGDNRVTDQLVRLYQDNNAVSQQLVSLEPRESKKLEFDYIPVRAGWQKLHIDLGLDAFEPDNRTYLTFFIPEKINVLLIGHVYSDIKPIELVLSGNEGVATHAMTDADPWQHELNNYNLIIFSNLSELTYQQSQMIPKYIESGGNVLFFPGNFSKPDEINRFLLQPLGKTKLAEIKGRARGNNGYFTLKKPNPDHPLFRGMFREKQSRFVSPELYRIFTWTGPDQSVLQLNTGEPLVQEIIHGKGTLLISGMGISPEWSNLILCTFFAPFIYRCTMYLGSKVGMNPSYITEDPIHLLLKSLNPDSPCEIINPNGVKRRVMPKTNGNNPVLTINDTSIPGFYEITQNELKQMIAVNVPNTESDFRIDEDKIKSYFKDADVQKIAATDHIHQALTESRYGREFWKELIILCLLFLVAETLVSRFMTHKSRK